MNYRHLVYPFEGNIKLVNKDRRGEIFYYMHQQVLARYKIERICNDMDDIERYSDFRKPIKEGYFPKMDTLVAHRAWPARPDGVAPQNLNRTTDKIKLNISDIEAWLIRFNKAIEDGFVKSSEGIQIPLDEVNGINMLGNMMESSILSPNREFYGNLHNSMHNLIAHCHDPDHRHKESFSVIGDSTTAMRDPVFYRIHAQVDDIFLSHKKKLNPYTAKQLTFPNISIASLEARHFQKPANTLHTFWRQSDVNLSRGLDFVPRGEVYAQFTHLQHIPYTVTMNVVNNSGANRQGMVRLFLAPKSGFNRKLARMDFNDQRIFMIELDKFFVNRKLILFQMPQCNNFSLFTVKPGSNTVTRRSVDSNVTIPHEQTFRVIAEEGKFVKESDEEAENNICGCGWPQHMLIPRGTTEGKVFDLFAMVSNFEEDQIVQDLVGQCTKATAYCGLRDRKYPDRRAMGYPFDRNGRTGTKDLASFLTPNMRAQEITIKFTDRVIKKF